MGLSPVSWQEIKAWSELTETKLDLWETLSIKNLSNIYTTELSQGSDPKRAAPYVATVQVNDWGSRFATMLRSLKKRSENEE